MRAFPCPPLLPLDVSILLSDQLVDTSAVTGTGKTACAHARHGEELSSHCTLSIPLQNIPGHVHRLLIIRQERDVFSSQIQVLYEYSKGHMPGYIHSPPFVAQNCSLLCLSKWVLCF